MNLPMNLLPGMIWWAVTPPPLELRLAPFHVYMVENVFRIPLCTNSSSTARLTVVCMSHTP